MVHFIASAVAALKLLERECPQCHHQQLIPRSLREQPAKCNHCGAMIPPKPKQGEQ